MRGEFDNLHHGDPDVRLDQADSGDSSRREMADSEAVVRLFSQHQRWLFGYLTSLLGDPGDAEDAMQEVSVIVWKDHHKFELGTNFTAWLSVIAYHQAQKFWRQRKRDRMFMNPEVLEQVACLPQDFELMESRRSALSDCVAQLRDLDRVLVKHIYGDRKVSAKQVAAELGRPAGTVYKALNRVRRSLYECVNRKMQAEGLA